MVRLSRAGGETVHQGQRDRPMILVELWEESSSQAFDAIQLFYAAFQVIGHRGELLDGVAAHDVQVQPPYSLEDPLAVDLTRVQFTAELTVDMSEVRLSEQP